MPPPAARRILVVAGGDTAPPPGLAATLPDCDTVIAADSGVHHATLLGLRIDIVIGDFDSAAQSAVDDAVAAGARVVRYPTDKDKTDLELALDHASLIGGPPAEIVVVASFGGRVDHALANMLLLASPRYRHHRIDAYIDQWLVSPLCDEERQLDIPTGATVSLLVIDAPTVRVTTTGLRYALADEPMDRFSTRGVSNVVDASPITIRTRGGVLFVLREWAH